MVRKSLAVKPGKCLIRTVQMERKQNDKQLTM
jgi:hypothetical protein